MHSSCRRISGDAGFTLLELLAAIALSSLLLIGTLGVTAKMAEDLRNIESAGQQSDVHRHVRKCLTNTLENGRTYQLTAGELRIRGYGGRSEHGRRTLRPTEIALRIISVDETSWLVQDVVPLDQWPRRGERHVVCHGIESILVHDSLGQRNNAAGDLSRAVRFIFLCQDGSMVDIGHVR